MAFSRQVYERYIRVEVRHKIKDFSQFWKLYLEGLKKLRDKTKELEDTTFMYKTEKRAIFTAPAERIFEKDKPSFSRKNDALQVMGESLANSDGLMSPGDETEETDEGFPPEEIDANREQEDSRTVSFEVEDELQQTEGVQTQNDYSDSWLANVRYSADRPF